MKACSVLCENVPCHEKYIYLQAILYFMFIIFVYWFVRLFGIASTTPSPLCPSHAPCALYAYATPCFTTRFVCVHCGAVWRSVDPCTHRLIKRHREISLK